MVVWMCCFVELGRIFLMEMGVRLSSQSDLHSIGVRDFESYRAGQRKKSDIRRRACSHGGVVPSTLIGFPATPTNRQFRLQPIPAPRSSSPSASPPPRTALLRPLRPLRLELALVLHDMPCRRHPHFSHNKDCTQYRTQSPTPPSISATHPSIRRRASRISHHVQPLRVPISQVKISMLCA